MSIAGVVLAAGSSTRLGRPKQNLILDESTGETLVERAVRVAIEAELAPVIVVVRSEVDSGFAVQQMGAVIVPNDKPAEGMASSIRLGTHVARMVKATGAVVMTCDQVMLSSQHIEALCRDTEQITGSRYAGRTGVPAYFPAAIFDQLERLTGDAGARELLRGAAFVENEALSVDIDTVEDVARATALLCGDA